MTAPDIRAQRIGAEREPVVIVENFHPDAARLRAFAAVADFAPAGRHYPGIRAALPDDYVAETRAVLATVLREAFGGGARAGLLDASFSMVTTPPAALSLSQRIPHVDAVEPGRIALVHYLADGDGTAFFRHRATGFETIGADRADPYYERLNAELRAGGEPAAAYIRDSGPLFERIALVEGRMNRAVIYRSALLHSGAIAPDAVLSADPVQGRLTVTAFLQV